MAVKFNLRNGNSYNCNSKCNPKDGCPVDRCPDFTIRRHDTRPSFKVSISDCDGPFDLNGLIIETNMWAMSKLRTDLDETTDYISFVENKGFYQVMVGDIIFADNVRTPEKMLVLAFDEKNKLIKVQRGYHGTSSTCWSKGDTIRIFRILNSPCEAEIELDDSVGVDGERQDEEIVSSSIVYNWNAEDTCLPGCYWMEFKVIKMTDPVYYLHETVWDSLYHRHVNGLLYTGSRHTDSSVQIQYNQEMKKRCVVPGRFEGNSNLNIEDKLFTGTNLDDGSVELHLESSQNVTLLSNNMPSIIPSFSDETLTPKDYHCGLGEHVEWIRRFPTSGEGFLIKVTDSPTSEV